MGIGNWTQVLTLAHFHQQSHLSSLFLDPPFFPSARGMHINFHPFTSGQRWDRSTSFPSSSNDLAFTCLFEVIWFTLTYCCASWQIIWDYQVHAVFFKVPRVVCSRSGQHQSLLDHLWNSTFLLCLLHLPQLFLSSNCLSSLDTLFIYWLTAPPLHLQNTIFRREGTWLFPARFLFPEVVSNAWGWQSRWMKQRRR